MLAEDWQVISVGSLNDYYDVSLKQAQLKVLKVHKMILEGHEIDTYNHGDLRRDFTFWDDLSHAIRLLIDALPAQAQGMVGDSLTLAAPFRVVRIGISKT